MRLTSLLSLALPALAAAAAGSGKALKNVFLDFDGTIVTTDAFDTFALASYISAPASLAPWEYFSNTYYDAYYAAEAAFGGDPSNLRDEIAFQASELLRDAEVDSFDRVKAAGVFTHATAKDLLAVALNVTIRDGFYDFLEDAGRRGVEVQVVSRAWSPRWIRTVLRMGALKANRSPYVVEALRVVCPEILPAGLLTPGARGADVDAAIFSGVDKVNVIKPQLRKNQKWVFVGDANSDLEPILAADVGVVAGADASSARTLKKEGVPLWKGADGWKGETSTKTGVYLIESFAEMGAILGWGKKY